MKFIECDKCESKMSGNTDKCYEMTIAEGNPSLMLKGVSNKTLEPIHLRAKCYERFLKWMDEQGEWEEI